MRQTATTLIKEQIKDLIGIYPAPNGVYFMTIVFRKAHDERRLVEKTKRFITKSFSPDRVRNMILQNLF